MKNYSQYRVEDFVLDDYFRDWVLTKSTKCEAFWQVWIKNHPEKRGVVEEAREILLALQPEHPKINPRELEEGFREISFVYNRIIGRHKKFINRRLILLVAISLILILSVFFLC